MDFEALKIQMLLMTYDCRNRNEKINLLTGLLLLLSVVRPKYRFSSFGCNGEYKFKIQIFKKDPNQPLNNKGECLCEISIPL